METFVTHSQEETHDIAKKLSSSLSSNIICLWGELGAGKTIFAQGLADYYGITRAPSPTFTIIKEYSLNHRKYKRLYHIDLYRLDTAHDIRSMDLNEIWAQKDNLVIIEWPQKALSLLPEDRVDVFLESQPGGVCRITIK